METRRLAAIWHRIYADFFMPTRLEAYREFLQEVINCGYHICSVSFFWEQIKSRQVRPLEKYLVLRHDIDTDVTTAKAMWQIEQSLGVRSSYYFRLSTIDIPFMREIELSKGEASYHYEELATLAKQKCLKTPEQVFREIPYIREMFRQNLNSLRQKSRLPMKVVASHGDFVNRELRVYNWEFLKDESFRKEIGVELEVYDEAFTRHITSRHSDTLYPVLWKPENPLRAVQMDAPVVYVLVHPRHWQPNPKENLVDDIKRALEGLRYSLAR